MTSSKGVGDGDRTAARHHGRHLRPDPQRASRHRRRGPLAVRPRRGRVRPDGAAVAEAGRGDPTEDRYLMTVIPTASNPRFSVSRIEIDEPGPTYTVETLRRLRATVAEGTRLFFISG